MDALLPGPQDGPTPVPCRSHAGPRLPVGTGGGGGDTTEASPTAGPQWESRPGPWGAISVPPLATRSGPVRSGPLRSPPPQRASESLVRKSGQTTGTPRVPRGRARHAIHGLPLKARARHGRKPRDTEGPTTDRSHRPDGVRAPDTPAPIPPRAEEGTPVGAGRPVQATPTPFSGSEAVAASHPHKPGGSISREPIARRHPRESGTITLVSPASWNSGLGTAAKCHPLLTSATLWQGDAI